MSPFLGRLLGTVLRLARPAARSWAQPGYFDPTIPAEPPRRLAILACEWVGDTFWASQVVPFLREKWPDCEMTAITKPHAVDLWNGLVPPDRIVAAPEVVSDRRRENVNWRALVRRARDLRERGYDLVISLTASRYAAFFTFLLRPGWSIGFQGNELGWLYSRSVFADWPAEVHLSQRPFRVIEPLLGRFAYPGQLRPPTPTRPFADVCHELGLDPSQPVAVIAPGAGWAQKQWPAENFAGVAAELRRHGRQIAMAGTGGQRELCQRLAQRVQTSDSSGPRVVVAAGLPLGKVCGLLSGATAVVCNDSGIGHLAAALGRRTVVIFTSATRPTACRPIGPAAIVQPDPGGPSAVLGALDA